MVEPSLVGSFLACSAEVVPKEDTEHLEGWTAKVAYLRYLLSMHLDKETELLLVPVLCKMVR